MRKLIMWNITTLDGYFEGEKNGIYLFTIQSGDQSWRNLALSSYAPLTTSFSAG